MDGRTKSIALGGAAILVLVAIGAAVFYVMKITPGGGSSGPATDLSSRLPVVSSPSSPTPAPAGELKTYSASAFSLHYPAGWGLLTCANSQNIEFDPANGADLKGVLCDMALKPVTVLLTGPLNCPGESVALGGRRVVRLKVTTGDTTRYRWCVPLGGRTLDITHRVSPSGSRATSKEDFSSQVEQIISTISTGGS